MFQIRRELKISAILRMNICARSHEDGSHSFPAHIAPLKIN